MVASKRFSVDVAGLFEALTEQFPEPLLCVRELIQNAADAGAGRIEVDASFDPARQLLRLAVSDDGRGMDEEALKGYLTIGFSEKDPNKDRGRFGIGKLSAYALDIKMMVVETSDGRMTHRLVFNRDGTGTMAKADARPRGTVVRVYKECDRAEAERLATRTFELVEERCGSIRIPLFVNGRSVNKAMSLGTTYAVAFQENDIRGVIGIAAVEQRALMGGGIVLEAGASVLGHELSYALDCPRLAPTLSRNAVRRDREFDRVVVAARKHLASLTGHVCRELRRKLKKLQRDGDAVERRLDANDRAAVDWLRTQLLDPESTPEPVIRSAPVLETADGQLVSAEDLVDVIRKEGRLPSSRVPRMSDELAAYIDRGVPVLLLYSDLEDFLERHGIQTVDAGASEDGVEVAQQAWSVAERALATQTRGRRRRSRLAVLIPVVAASIFAVYPLLPDRTVVSQSGSTLVDGAALGVPSPPGRPVLKMGPVPRLDAHERGLSRSVAFGLGIAVAALALTALLAGAFAAFRRRRESPESWLRREAGLPLVAGSSSRGRAGVIRRVLLNPIDFIVARGWSVRSSGGRSLSAASQARGRAELSGTPAIRSGIRLDLGRVEIGFVDLMSAVGEPHDGRILVARGSKAILNRNHPTVRNLLSIARQDPRRARLLLDILLATDPELARGTDPRQVEWDLLGRAQRTVEARHD